MLQRKKISNSDKSSIPAQYRGLWTPFAAEQELVHYTTEENLSSILATGYLRPHDPAPNHWSGMKAVFLGKTDDPQYPVRLPNVLNLVRRKGSNLRRLTLKVDTDQIPLFRSLDPLRTYQVIALTPIPASCIARIEEVRGVEQA